MLLLCNEMMGDRVFSPRARVSRRVRRRGAGYRKATNDGATFPDKVEGTSIELLGSLSDPRAPIFSPD